MAAFDKSALLAALKPKTQKVAVEGFGDVTMSQLTVEQVETLRSALKKNDASDEFGLRLVRASVVDEDGNCVFTDADMDALKLSSNSAMDGLVSEALRVNGFRKDLEAKN